LSSAKAIDAGAQPCLSLLPVTGEAR